MLIRANRLSKNKDFERVFRRGRRFSSVYLTIVVSERKAHGKKVGFIVSNKTLRRATDRNRVKRRLREIVRGLMSQILEGTEAIIIVRKDPESLSPQALRDETLELFKRSGAFVARS